MLEWWSGLDTQLKATALSAMATLFAGIATALSAYAAWRGPAAAVRIAETMRRDAELAADKRRTKLAVFGQLMEQRAAWYADRAVQAFNLIDIVFIENRAVRDAWAEFFASLDENKGIPEHEKNKRFRVLLLTMARDLNLDDGLRLDDFERVYYPTALAEENHLRILQRQEALRQLRGDLSPSANTAPTSTGGSLFPPPPK